MCTEPNAEAIQAVRNWVHAFVVDMNLCPFAGRELINKRVRFAVCDADNEDALLQALQVELSLLEHDDAVETTLLIHPCVLQSFEDYNQFLDACDGLLTHLQLDGVLQIASFHPGYQFDGTAKDAPENFTNRSPYPLLHILREASLDRVVEEYSDVEQIPIRNVELMNQLGTKHLQGLLKTCIADQTGLDSS